MKKYVLFLFVLVFICMSSGASSQTWEQIGPYGPRTVLKVAESDSALVILCDIAFGAGKRRIFRSEDKGKTWQEPSFPYDSLPIWLMGLDCTENIFYAWTERADICMSTDHGKTWVVRSDIDSQRLYFEFGSVLTIDDTLYFGWDKKYFTSIDSGLTWSSQKASVDDRMIRSAVLNDTIITVTDHEVYYSADRAGSWKKISPSFQVDDDVKRDIAVLDGTIYVSTHRRVYYSSDMGSSWSVSDTFAVDKLLSPYLAAYASRLWIASRESLYYTSDRFATLHEASPPPGTRTGYSLTATKNGLLHSSYEGGAHLSFDTARTWTYIQEKVTPRAMSNVWVKDDLLIAGSESGILMCSTNNGNSWNRSFHSNPIDNRSNQFNALFALGDSLFVTTDKDHHIIRSGDNGMTWTTNQKEFPWSVTLDMVGNDMIWVAVTLFNGYMYRSTDRGASWTLIEGEYTASRFSEILLHDSTFFLAWHDTGLLRSNADATAFERLTDVGALPPGKCFSVASNGKTLFAGINRHIYRSRDSGVTWQEMNFLFDNEVYDIKCYGTNVVILDRPQEMYQKKTMVYYSPNECDTIISLSPDGFISRSSSEVAINNKYIFAQSIDWGILRYNYLPLVSVSEIKEQQQFTLYPNPAQTVVNIEAPDKANAIVHLFDMLGREVRRERLSEEGKLTLDVSDLTNGIYTVMLEYKGTTSKSTIVVMK